MAENASIFLFTGKVLGAVQWTKMEGETLMLRMGIPPEYFESLSSGEDLERWRKREDICLLIPGRPEEAGAAIDDYRGKYKKRERLEDSFNRYNDSYRIKVISYWEDGDFDSALNRLNLDIVTGMWRITRYRRNCFRRN